MSDGSPGSKLTEDQVVVVYERTLNRAIILNLVSMLAGIGLAVIFYYTLEPFWVKVLAAMLAILAGGMVQRLFVLRVRCPACGARVLGHIHSIIQVRNVTHCPACDARLRG